MIQRQIFADYNATTPCTKAHLEALCCELGACDGNPSSIHHYGRLARVALDRARKAIAGLIGAKSYQIFFTSGATESNNMVLQGFTRKAKANGLVPSLVISTFEHPSIDQTARELFQRNECRLDFVPVDSSGFILQEPLVKLLVLESSPSGVSQPLLVSLIHVNNEVGTCNPAEGLAALVKNHRRDAFFHMDAVQSLGKHDLSWVGKSHVDALSFSAHKVGALKGIGCLYLKDPAAIHPLTFGGQQETGARPGTENLPGAISFGLVAKTMAAAQPMGGYLKDSCDLAQKCRTQLASILGVHLHGAANQLSNTVNFHMKGVTGQELMIQFDMAGIAVSSGSACSAGTPKPSRVLLAMGHSEEVARNSIRLSFGVGSQYEDIHAILGVLTKLRQKYPHT